MLNEQVLGYPTLATVTIDGATCALEPDGRGCFGGNGVEVRLSDADGAMRVVLSAPGVAVERIQLRWSHRFPSGVRLLGDHWERGYGDLEWRGIVPERVMPWYFLAADGRRTEGFGVRTGCASLCFWRADASGVSLYLDVRSGGVGVLLGDRALLCAEIVYRGGNEYETPFEAASALCSLLCPSPRLPDHQIYGSNNWYYAYGDSSHEAIIRDTEILMGNAPSGPNAPYMVIDAGWAKQSGPWDIAAVGSDWTVGNDRFPDMPGLASALRTMGARPGIWFRPLAVTSEYDSSLLLNESRLAGSGAELTMDPTIPENLAKVEADTRMMAEWGYTLIKHDFSTFDIFGRWGLTMGWQITNPGWAFADRSRTSAEIVLDLYAALRRGAGDAVVIGCNTIGHLAAGIFEMQRTGDDTSGLVWERTRAMGLNTLAFRMPQHRRFFECDADCVGLTKRIPWELNARWLDVLARSGTPLFVSASPDAIGSEQRAALKEAFALASVAQPIADPLDWMDTVCPRVWRQGGEIRAYTWDDGGATGQP